MVTYSHSRLSTFEQCSLKYKYKYIDKIKTDISTTIEAFMGDKVHRALEKLYKDLQFQHLNTEEDLINYYVKIWDEEWDDSILIVKDYSPDNYKKKGELMIKNYYKRYHPFDQEITIGLETQFYYDLNDDYKIHIRIDRLCSPEEGVYEIHDYKTSNSLPTQEEADKDRQLAIYSLGVKEKYKDAKKVVLVWHYLQFDKTIKSVRSEEQLEDLRKSTISLIKNIEKQISYEPQQSPLCDYCEYQSICPLWKHLFEAKKNNFKEDTSELVKNYVLLKEKENLLKNEIENIGEKLKIVAENKGAKALFSDEHMLNIWSKEVHKAPKKNDPRRPKFVQVLKSLNIYELYSDVHTWELEKNYDNLSEIEKQVLNHFMEKQKLVRFYINKR